MNSIEDNHVTPPEREISEARGSSPLSRIPAWDISTSTLFSRVDVLLLFLLACLVALFFWRILTPNDSDRAQFPSGDFTSQFYAFRLYEARAFASGRLPLWSEDVNSGHPFLADVQAAVFYPIGLVNTLLNVAISGPNFSLFTLELEAILHFFLAGAFTYMFARRLTAGRTGAFTAALTFTFGGYLTSYPSLQLAILETATWLPLALYFLDRAAENLSLPVPLSMRPPAPSGEKGDALIGNRMDGGSLANLILGGLVLGISALAGHPQTFLFVIATSALFFAFRVWRVNRHSPHRRRSSILLFLVAVIIALGIAAAQWIPSLEYQQLSTREALTFRDAGAGFPTLDVLQFIFPGFTSAFASPLYVGILPLWLACLALTRLGAKRAFWGLLALAALLLSFGFYFFAYAVLYLVPGGGLFREQERLAFIVSFGLAILAGLGLEDLFTLASAGSRQIRRVFILLPAGVVVSFALVLTFFSAGAQTQSGRLAFLGDRAGLMLVLFFLASALVAVYIAGRLPTRYWASLAMALIIVDLFSVNEPANKAAVADPFPVNPLVQTVRQDPGVFRVADEGLLPGHFGIAYQLEEVSGISPLRLAHYENLLTLPPDKLLPLLNVRYLFADRSGFPNSKLLAQDGQTRLFSLNDSLPRAWLVGAADAMPDDAKALDLMRSGDFSPRRMALLAKAAPFAVDPRASDGKVTIDKREPERLSLGVSIPFDGLLLVAENYYPGWYVSVDGVQEEIIRADISLRAVPLRAGSHRVEFMFDPLSVKVGLAISAGTLLFSLIGLGVVKMRGSRSEVNPGYNTANGV